MTNRPALKYIILSEKDGPHHVLIERPGSPWLQRVASFHSYDRADSYAGIENDMYEDDCDASWAADEKALPPTLPEPQDRLGSFILFEDAGKYDAAMERARLEGFEQGRLSLAGDIKAVFSAAEPVKSAAEPPKIAPAPVSQPPVEAAPVAARPPQPTPKIEAIRQPAPEPPKPYARPKDPSDRQLAVERIQATIVVDLPELMKEFPRGPITRDLQKKYGEPADWLGEALRNAHDKGLLRYELDPGRPNGRYDANKYVRPVGYKIPTLKQAAAAKTTPPKRPVDPPSAAKPLTDRIMTHIVGEYGRIGAFTLPEIARLLAADIIDVGLACEDLEKAGRCKFVTIDRTLGRQPVPLDWEPPKVDLKVNATAPIVSRGTPAPPAANLPAVRISPSPQALADFQRTREAKALKNPLARVVDHTPDHPPFVDLGEPPYERSALFQRHVDQERERLQMAERSPDLAPLIVLDDKELQPDDDADEPGEFDE
jgi:hypothetical protein